MEIVILIGILLVIWYYGLTITSEIKRKTKWQSDYAYEESVSLQSIKECTEEINSKIEKVVYRLSDIEKVVNRLNLTLKKKDK